MSPTSLRGTLGAVNQLAITGGILAVRRAAGSSRGRRCDRRCHRDTVRLPTSQVEFGGAPPECDPSQLHASTKAELRPRQPKFGDLLRLQKSRQVLPHTSSPYQSSSYPRSPRYPSSGIAAQVYVLGGSFFRAGPTSAELCQWRHLALCASAIPVVLAAISLQIPETPQYLLSKGDADGARATFRRLDRVRSGENLLAADLTDHTRPSTAPSQYRKTAGFVGILVVSQRVPRSSRREIFACHKKGRPKRLRLSCSYFHRQQHPAPQPIVYTPSSTQHV